MRVVSLLAGISALVAMTLAAPVSEDISATADIATDASLVPGKVRICNGLGGAGHCVEVDARFKCVHLSPPIRFNVQFIFQPKGNFCSYSQGKNCGDSAFVVDASKSEQRTDVMKWSNVIAAVQCISYPKTAEEDAETAFGVTSYARVESAPETLPKRDTDSSTAESASPAGDALLCSTDITRGPCFKVPSNGQCISVPPPVARNIHTIYQNKGSVCEYFDSDTCNGKLGNSDSTTANVQLSVPGPLAGRIAAARCRMVAMGGGGEEREGVFVAAEE